MERIIGIGNALVDVLVQLSDEAVLSQMGLPKGGMILIDDEQQMRLSECLVQLNPVRATGGSAGNAVLALARMGAKPGFVGRIGNDDMGSFFTENCNQSGIDARLVIGSGHSGVANTFITPDAERTFATYLGEASKLSASDITPSLFDGYDLLHVEGYLVQDHELIRRICSVAKECGLRLSIDLASYNVVRDNHSLLCNLVKDYIDIVFANEEESAAFTKGGDPESALLQIALMAETAVVKLGKRGAIAMRNGERAHVPGNSQNVIDTTAAGDFFAGGFLYGVTRGASLNQCLRLGSLLAGRVIQVIGTHLPDAQWQEIHSEAEKIITNNN